TSALRDAGYQKVIDVPEGMLGSFSGPGWLKTGLPVGAYGG
ncbi:MAG: rhodanese-like domain-containing protein, partial [Pseudomonadota bacterium]